MKLTVYFFIFLVFFLGSSAVASAQAAKSGVPFTGIATMFARDPLTQSLCFRDGGPGSVFWTDSCAIAAVT